MKVRDDVLETILGDIFIGYSPGRLQNLSLLGINHPGRSGLAPLLALVLVMNTIAPAVTLLYDGLDDDTLGDLVTFDSVTLGLDAWSVSAPIYEFERVRASRIMDEFKTQAMGNSFSIRHILPCPG